MKTVTWAMQLEIFSGDIVAACRKGRIAHVGLAAPLLFHVAGVEHFGSCVTIYLLTYSSLAARRRVVTRKSLKLERRRRRSSVSSLSTAGGLSCLSCSWRRRRRSFISQREPTTSSQSLSAQMISGGQSSRKILHIAYFLISLFYVLILSLYCRGE